MASIQLRINQEDLRKKLTRHARTKIMPGMMKNHIQNRRKEYVEIIIQYIKETDSWRSLLGEFSGAGYDDFQAVFGIGFPQAAMDEVEQIIRRRISMRLINNKYIRLSISPSVGDDLKQSDVGSYKSSLENDKGEQHIVPWLEWVLDERGHVDDYFIDFNLTTPEQISRSRSGEALMIHEEGESWDLAEGGNSNTNFLFQAVENPGLERDIFDLFRSTFIQSANKIL
jgi:hypothetical protein